MKNKSILSKFISMIFFCTMINDFSYSQCKDVFNRECDCPTENDSLVIYNNSIKVYEFYEKNTDYVKIKSKRLITKNDVLDCFYQLQDAVDSFRIRWGLREKVLGGEDIPSVLLPRDGKNIPIDNYYLYLDAYRFYQRELENGILNLSAPFPVYDIRIAPLLINSYENRLSTDDYNGDFVNVALYIPVTVKPYNLLTDSEKILRKKVLEGSVIILKKQETNKKKQIPVDEIAIMKKSGDSVILESSKLNIVLPEIKKEGKFTHPPPNSKPYYGYNGLGAGSIIGYLVGRKFRKFLPTDEFYWSLPKWVKDLLNDEEKLNKYLKVQLGDWYEGIYDPKKNKKNI